MFLKNCKAPKIEAFGNLARILGREDNDHLKELFVFISDIKMFNIYLAYFKNLPSSQSLFISQVANYTSTNPYPELLRY